MKLTFEGPSLEAIFDDMERILSRRSKVFEKPKTVVPDHPPIQRFSELPIVPKAIVQKDKPKRARTEKQLANDERLRVIALERMAAKRVAKAQAQAYATTLRNDLDRDPIERKPVQDAPEAQPFAEPEVDPAEAVRIRTKTIEDLQAAYANGHQQEVFELLSRFGNGAKSFRELPPESFVPIREAIDNGALT